MTPEKLPYEISAVQAGDRDPKPEAPTSLQSQQSGRAPSLGRFKSVGSSAEKSFISDSSITDSFWSQIPEDDEVFDDMGLETIAEGDMEGIIVPSDQNRDTV